MSVPSSPTPSRSPFAALRAFVDSLRARRSKTRDDRTLARSLYLAFERSEDRRYKGLHFQVVDGVVTVYGSVEQDDDRDIVFGRVAALPGVRAVSDRLHVDHRTPTGALRGLRMN
ncbi:MAG: BON domain-containing protein [Bacteroidota bacterium]